MRANEASKRCTVTRPNDQLLEPDTMAPSAPITVDAFPSDRGFLRGLSVSHSVSTPSLARKKVATSSRSRQVGLSLLFAKNETKNSIPGHSRFREISREKCYSAKKFGGRNMLFEGRVGVGEQVFPRAGRLLLERDGGDGAPCSIGLPLLPLEERVHAMRVEYARSAE